MPNFDEFFSRHERIVLELSGGKDSAAVLWLLEPYWGKLDVLWCNPGNPYPETLAYMHKIASIVPRFFTILGDQPRNVTKNGWPVDILPAETSDTAMHAYGVARPKLQSFWDCCSDNMWRPMDNWVKLGKYTAIIRGQKLSDTLKNFVLSGDIVDGVEYLHPIENWVDENVLEFLGDQVPDSYKRGLKSSLDCMNCTAYTAENAGRISDLALIDKTAYTEVTAVHLYLIDCIDSHLTSIRACHGN